jgi:hypothetical protein
VALALAGGGARGALGALAALASEFLDLSRRQAGGAGALTDAGVEDYTRRLDAGWLAVVEEEGLQEVWEQALAKAGG